MNVRETLPWGNSQTDVAMKCLGGVELRRDDGVVGGNDGDGGSSDGGSCSNGDGVGGRCVGRCRREQDDDDGVSGVDGSGAGGDGLVLVDAMQRRMAHEWLKRSGGWRMAM